MAGYALALMLGWALVTPARGAAQRVAYEHEYPFEPGASSAEDLPPWQRSGMALSLGLGTSYAGGLGGQVAYEWAPAPGRAALAPYASASVLLSEEALAGCAFGLMGAYGRTLRVLLDVGWGSFAVQGFRVFGRDAAARAVYGASTQLGLQWTLRSGFFARALGGLTAPTERVAGDVIHLAISLGVGGKL